MAWRKMDAVDGGGEYGRGRMVIGVLVGIGAILAAISLVSLAPLDSLVLSRRSRPILSYLAILVVVVVESKVDNQPRRR